MEESHEVDEAQGKWLCFIVQYGAYVNPGVWLSVLNTQSPQVQYGMSGNKCDLTSLAPIDLGHLCFPYLQV